jgi:hypothetical protein
MGTRQTEIECLAWYESAKGVWKFLLSGHVYLDMLEQFIEPQLLTDGILDTVGFQQDGAPCHYAIIVHDYLNRRFPCR